MRYKAVLFDMDGTVLDTLADLTNAVNHILSEFNMPAITQREAASYLGNGAAQLLRRAVPADTGEDKLAEMLRVYQPWYDSHCAILTAPYPGILPLMEALKAAGVKQAVISNKQDSAVKRLAARHFPGLLETAVGESDTVRRKPNPDAVLAALREMEVQPRDAVYIGDTEVDIQTAKNAGLACAVVGWGLALGGYSGEAAVQSASALFAIKALYTWVPMILIILGWILPTFVPFIRDAADGKASIFVTLGTIVVAMFMPMIQIISSVSGGAN